MKNWIDILEELGWSKQAIDDFKFLTREEEDLKEFEDRFFNLNETPTLILDKFRTYLLEKYCMSKSEFLNLAEENLKEALEKLFQHQVTDVELEVFNDRRKQWGLTLEDLYELHNVDQKKRLWSWLSTTYTMDVLSDLVTQK